MASASALAVAPWSKRATPIADPFEHGLTTTRSPSSRRARSASAAASAADPRSASSAGATGRPACAKSTFAMRLFIASALASTSAPTYGMSSTSSTPCSEPSSPTAPCATGKTTS